MAEQLQTYQNHTRLFAPFHFFVLPVLAANAINAIRHLVQNPTLGTGFALLVAAAILMLGLLSRVMTLVVQDRVIRLEMRLRLRECLPAELQKRIGDIPAKQLIALRFASDTELPELVRDVLAGKLSSPKDIKLRVKEWQGDFLRA